MKSHDPAASQTQQTNRPARKAYEKPQLQVYGDLTEITQSVNGSKMNDGAGHPNMHFTS
jgi:hypothetical protein